jgi:hypothetical protein
MIETSYNPDVLTCLANLSNDEVFTPPTVVNDMLDLLPVELWSNPKITFLDPVSKSGVFLREITKRLDKGLENVIPDKQERINHILDIYRIIYNKNLNTSQALNFIEEELPATDERDEIVTFIRESGRGIIKRFSKGSMDDE